MQFPKKSAEQLQQQQDSYLQESYFSEQDASRTMFGHIWKKMKEKPAIPIGLTTMLVVLGMMVYQRNDKYRLNQLAKIRIGLQGFTGGAVFYAMYQDERPRHESPYPWHWRTRGLGLSTQVTLPSNRNNLDEEDKTGARNKD